MKATKCKEVLTRLAGKRLATAESLTGGGIGAAITGTPGLAVYLPVMIGCSIVTGTFTGLCAQFLVKRRKDLWKTFSK